MLIYYRVTLATNCHKNQLLQLYKFPRNNPVEIKCFHDDLAVEDIKPEILLKDLYDTIVLVVSSFFQTQKYNCMVIYFKLYHNVEQVCVEHEFMSSIYFFET